MRKVRAVKVEARGRILVSEVDLAKSPTEQHLYLRSLHWADGDGFVPKACSKCALALDEAQE